MIKAARRQKNETNAYLKKGWRRNGKHPSASGQGRVAKGANQENQEKENPQKEESPKGSPRKETPKAAKEKGTVTGTKVKECLAP